MTTIWARRSSSNAQKVFWALAELQVPHRQVNTGAKYGIVDDAEYRKKNPNGLVPTLEEDDGFVLFESNAIVRYLADRYGRGTLQPSDARDRARADSYMDWLTSTLEPPINGLWFRRVLGRERFGLAPDEELITAARRALGILAERLSPEHYLLGESLSIGDIALGVIVNRWYKLDIPGADLPRIRRYHELLSTRKPYRDHVIDIPPPLT
ncbi:MAG: glutathione S-transferase family protein [Polyangiales bacterium]